MTPASLISDLTARGVELRAYGDKVRFRPVEKLTTAEVDSIRQHKEVILKLLRSEPSQFTNGPVGGEHFSLWIYDPDAPWPEFIPGFHYDTSQPSHLRPLCCPPATPIQPDRLRQVLTECDHCGSTEYVDVRIHNGRSVPPRLCELPEVSWMASMVSIATEQIAMTRELFWRYRESTEFRDNPYMSLDVILDKLATNPDYARMAKPTSAKVSDQLRYIIEDCGLSRYEISKRTGIDEGTLSRFIYGERGLSMKALDRLGDALGLKVSMRRKPKSTKG